MKMYDCDVCMSAGSVNKWGYCEICGEDFEDPDSLVRWHGISVAMDDSAERSLVSATVGELVVVGQDAA
ncbi:MAG: hypothetical protein Q7K29_08755 [Thermoleophilia bacterium]|nr:hypothetical protein [Thermoleophilia bacterium]